MLDYFAFGFILALCILLIHFLLKTKFHYLPESVAVVFLGKLHYLWIVFQIVFGVNAMLTTYSRDSTIFIYFLET